MRLQKLKREFGTGVEVRRDQKTRVVTVTAGGLGYQADERRFRDEAELAQYINSKMPMMTVRPL